MSVVDFPGERNKQTTIATITYKKKGEADLSLEITAFGHADERSELLVFYNDNISDMPILVVNQDSLRQIQFNPMIEKKELEETSH